VKAAHRVIDANLNRSREALRVCEDITRFILDDAFLTKSLKDVRHKISRIADRLIEKSLNSRDIGRDVGKAGSFDKIKAEDFTSLFYKNIHRAEESIRSLEEFSKLASKRLSTDFKALRFKVYSVEKKAIKKLLTLRSN